MDTINIKQAFELFDDDDDGKLTVQQFITLTKNMGIDCGQFVDKIDTITLQQFINFIEQSTVNDVSKQDFINICKSFKTYNAQNNTINSKELVSMMINDFKVKDIMSVLHNTIQNNEKININKLIN